MILKAEDLHAGYSPDLPVLAGVSLQVAPGEVVGIFGMNGSGKTTLRRCLNGSLPLCRGRVLLGATSLVTLSPKAIARSIAVVPQVMPEHLPFSVRDVVMQGRFPHWNWWRQETAEDERIVDAVLHQLKLEALRSTAFEELSGGERQRVIVARALAQQAPVLLLDEPAAHLDLGHHLELLQMLHRLSREGRTILIICHDVFLAPLFLDRAILLYAGEIYAEGNPTEVLSSDKLELALGAKLKLTWSGKGSVCAALPLPPMGQAVRRF